MISRYTVNNIIKDANRKLHNSGISMTTDPYGALDEARRSMIGRIKPTELKREAFIENALYDQVDRYAVPDDMQYENVIDIKMLASRHNLDTMSHPLEMVYEKRFDQKRRSARNIYTINYTNGVKYMKINHPRGLKLCQHRVLNECESLSVNGTWNVGGNIENLGVDKLNHISGKSALIFDINTSSTSGFIENFNMTPVDIQEYMETGSLFTWLDLNKLDIVTSVTLRFGSSVTDYYEYVVNQPHDNNQFLAAWNLLRYPLEARQLTQVGFPNARAINYLRVDITTTGTEPMYGAHLDNIVARKGVVYQSKYNSSYCFVDRTTQAWKQFATRTDDIIVAEEDTYQILLLEFVYVLMQEAYDNSNKSQDDILKIEAQLEKRYAGYTRKHKQDAILAYDSTYIFGDQYSGLTDDPLNDWGDNDDFNSSIQNNNC